MRADRLLSAILLLQAHGKLTGRVLASRLEVSQRTVHRDMEALSAAGVPVFALRGAQGGWRLDDDWRTRVPGFDDAELRALLMSQPRVIGDRALAAAAERAVEKLMAAMPAALRERAVSIRQRLHVDTTGWWGGSDNLDRLPIVQDAVWRDRKLSIRYRRKDHERVNREVDPLGLVAKGTTWYLVANTPAGFRTYRVSRIEDATLLESASVRPADFDLAAYWQKSTIEFQEGRPRYAATLRLAPRAAEDIKMWRMVSAVGDHQPDAEGWTTLRVNFESEYQARFVVLGFGVNVDVIEPESLRESVAADIATMFGRTRREQQDA